MERGRGKIWVRELGGGWGASDCEFEIVMNVIWMGTGKIERPTWPCARCF